MNIVGMKRQQRCDVESVIATLEDSGLRGMGGASFLATARAEPRLMAVNIGEGDQAPSRTACCPNATSTDFSR